MPEENVETVLRAYEVLNEAGTIDDLMDGLRPMLHPDAEWVNPSDALEVGTRSGFDGWRTALENLRGGLGADLRLEVEELIEKGDAVFATGKAHVSGTASGVEAVGPTWAAIWVVKDGRISRYEWSWDIPEMRQSFFEAAT